MCLMFIGIFKVITSKRRLPNSEFSAYHCLFSKFKEMKRKNLTCIQQTRVSQTLSFRLML